MKKKQLSSISSVFFEDGGIRVVLSDGREIRPGKDRLVTVVFRGRRVLVGYQLMANNGDSWVPANAFRLAPDKVDLVKGALKKAGLLDKVLFLKRESFVDLMVGSDTDLVNRISDLLKVDKVSSL